MARVTVGVSLKMYFGHRAAKEWLADAADIAATTASVARGNVELFVAPTYLQLLPALEAFAGTRTVVAAQDASEHDSGAFTGDVSPAELAEVGVRLVELGHAERRRLHGETDAVVAAKAAAALRNGLTPLICVGEPDRVDADAALAFASEQVLSALADAPGGRVVIAYEPVWAIGAPEPAPVAHIRAVTSGLRALLDTLVEHPGSAVIYGGSAGPGLLTELGDSVDGLFLGRFAHDLAGLREVLAEAESLAARGD